MKLIVVILSFVFMSCNGQKKVAMQDDEDTNGGLELLLQEEQSTFELAETMIVKDAKRLKRFYSKVNMTRKPGISVPEVDFTKEMVIIQCMGELKGSGMPILDLVSETDTEIVLGSKLKTSAKSAIETTIHPFCIYKMPLTEKEITIESND